MKAINIYVEDKDFETLKELKGKQSWRDFLISKTMNKEMKELIEIEKEIEEGKAELMTVEAFLDEYNR
ncbi:MAG: hypothetical protein Q8R00_02400 [Candidatus Nanoarchaeia archaeon]|nr:hypothetical protein [Candidatus Nanoarchaeia archaeon]